MVVAYPKNVEFYRLQLLPKNLEKASGYQKIYTFFQPRHQIRQIILQSSIHHLK